MKTPQPMCQNSDKPAPTRVWAAHFLTLGWHPFWESILISMHQRFHEILHQFWFFREIAVVYEEIDTHLYWISPHFITPSGLSAFRKELYLSSSSPSLLPIPFFSYLAYQNNYDRKCTLIQVNITYLPNWFLTSLRLLSLSKLKLQKMKDKNCKRKKWAFRFIST